MKISDTLNTWFYGAGLLIVAGSHIYMLVAGFSEDQIIPHSIINLVAVALLAFGWLRRAK